MIVKSVKTPLTEKAAALIDEYGVLKTKKEAAERRMKEIAEGYVENGENVPGLKDLLVVGATYSTEKFRAVLSETAKRIIDPKVAFKKLTKEQFLSVVTVGVQKVEDMLGKEATDEMVESFAVTPMLRVNPLKGGK